MLATQALGVLLLGEIGLHQLRSPRFSNGCAGALRTTPSTAGRAEQASAVPAPRHRLQRIADQLSNQENFDHRQYLSSPRQVDRAAFQPENTALFASAMQLNAEFTAPSGRAVHPCSFLAVSAITRP